MPVKKHNIIPSENISRRIFIKTAVVAATAFTIVPRFVLGGKNFIAPSDTSQRLDDLIKYNLDHYLNEEDTDAQYNQAQKFAMAKSMEEAVSSCEW